MTSDDKLAMPARMPVVVLFLVAGVVAAIGSGFSVMELGAVFVMPQELVEELANSKGANPPQELMDRMRAAGVRNRFHNAALALGVSGGLLCACLGGLAGWFRRRAVGAVLGMFAGTVLGGAAGVAGGLLGVFVDQRISIAEMDEFQRAVLMQLAEWTPVGLAAGLAVGMFAGSMRATLGLAFASMMTAGIGGGVYPIASMILLPTNRLSRPLPDSLFAVLLWTGLPSILVAFATGRLISACRNPRTKTATATSERSTATS